MRIAAGGLTCAIAVSTSLLAGPSLLSQSLPAPSPPAPAEATTPWAKFVGTWRADPRAIEGHPKAPYLLRMAIEGDVLIMEWHSMAEQHAERLPLDGSPITVADNGRPAERRLAIDGAALVVTSRRTLPGGTTTSEAISYAVNRNRLTIDRRPQQVASGEVREPEIFTKVPTNTLTHGGTGALGPTGRQQ